MAIRMNDENTDSFNVQGGSIMNVYHRIVGNFPKIGHAGPLQAGGFDAAHPLTGFTLYRLPGVGSVSPNAAVMHEDGVQEIQRVYEVHAIAFGRYASAHSSSFKIRGGRPYNYTDMVVICDQAEKRHADIETVLGFDGFVTVDDFLTLSDVNASARLQSSLSAIKTSAEAPAAFHAPAMDGTLLACIWRALSERMASGCIKPSRTVTVCLGKEERSERIIEQAKAFLKQILACLPAAVGHIASMSASVPRDAVSGIFQTAALAVVYPHVVSEAGEEADCGADFDLRHPERIDRRREAEDSPVERAFASALAEEGQPALAELREMYRRYAQAIPDAAEEACTFMADYRVALMAFALTQEKLISKENRLGVCWQLYRRLTEVHKLAEKTAVHVMGERLSPAQVLTQTLSMLLKEESAQHWPDEQLCKAVSEVYARCGSQAHLEQIGEYFSSRFQAGPCDMQALLHMMDCFRVDMTCALEKMIKVIRTQNIGLSDGAFVQLLEAALPRCAAGVSGIRTQVEGFVDTAMARPERPQQQMERLCRLCGAFERLGVDPGRWVYEALKAIGDKRELMAEEQAFTLANRLLPLCGNQAAILSVLIHMMNGLVQDDPLYFLKHKESLRSLSPLFAVLSLDMTSTFCKALETALEHEQTFTPEEIALLAERMLPQCHARQTALDGLDAYVGKTMARGEGDQAFQGFIWAVGVSQALDGLNPAESSFAGKLRLDAVGSLLRSCERQKKAPDAPSFDVLERLLTDDGALLAGCQADVLAMYEALMSRQNDADAVGQIRRLLPILGSLSDAPNAARVCCEQAADRLAKRLKEEDYFVAVEHARDELAKHQIPLEELPVSRVYEPAAAALERRLERLKTHDDFCRAYEEDATRPSLGIWTSVFSTVYAGRYDAFMGRAASFEEMERIRTEAILRLKCDIEHTDAERCWKQIKAIRGTIEGELVFSNAQDAARLVARAIAQLDEVRSTSVIGVMQAMLKRFYMEEHVEELRNLGLPAPVAIGLIACYDAASRTMDWPTILYALSGCDESCLHTPYAPEGIGMLCTVSAVFRVLQDMGDAAWGRDLAAFLWEVQPFAAYSQRVRSDERKRKRHLPMAEGGAKSPIGMWIHAAGATGKGGHWV